MGTLYIPVGEVLGYVIDNCPIAGYTITFDPPFDSADDYSVSEPRATVGAGADLRASKATVVKYADRLVVTPEDDLAHVELSVIPKT